MSSEKSQPEYAIQQREGGVSSVSRVSVGISWRILSVVIDAWRNHIVDAIPAVNKSSKTDWQAC
jgi:hypothetical protein